MPRALGEVGLKRTQFQFANVIRSLKVGGILVLLGYSPKQLEYNRRLSATRA